MIIGIVIRIHHGIYSSLDRRVLQLIDKEIPYHIFFLLVHQERAQAWIGYKEQGKTGKYTPGAYYHTQWQPVDKLSIKLEGLNMDAVYEGFIRQIAGERLQDQPGDLKEAVARDEQRQKLQRRLLLWRTKCAGKSNSTSKSHSTVS